MTVDLNKSPGKTVDPVNPYAVIALVAALLGLIPVAIVFGILAFWRPAGRGLAIAALILGAIEAIVVATVFGFGTGLTAEDSTNATSYQDYSLPATPLAAPPTSVIVPSLTTPPPADTTIEVTEDPPLTLPAVDESCDPAVDNHATSSDSTFLKCAYAGRSTARWVRSAPIIAYAEQGGSCDPSARGIAVSPEGVDMVCVSNGGGEAGYWVPGP